MHAGNLSARKLLLTVALIAVTGAACGSSSKTATNSTTATTAASSGSPTTASGQTATTTPTTKSFSGSSGSSFCDLARTEKAAFNDNKSIATKTPADIKALYGKLVPALENAANQAPSAIKSDFQIYVTELKKIDAALAAAQYNFQNLDPTKLATFNTPQLETAAANIQKYFTQVCHITAATTPTT